jgi:eukaryotic-like serine/threonine-protein kinase
VALIPGTRLGVYQIAAPLGAGGMGAVFRARDTKLDRDVAIKVLPEAFAHDADRLARFTREAKTLAALNHPHIAAIYGLEESNGITALVMELVEGDDLSEKIRSGTGNREPGTGMPLDEALPIARQIAEALEAAHEQGIIHRDLKPANIKVRADGTVKVLDFGLAKALDQGSGIGDQGSGSAANSPTITSPAMTQAGMILGTAAYMAPEQARGKIVDRRADVWAFGAVLFEMLTGARAFRGGDVMETIVSVLSKEPDWTQLPASLSPTVAVYLKRCLHKDPKQRIGDIRDVRLALEGAFETDAPQTATPILAARQIHRPVRTRAAGRRREHGIHAAGDPPGPQLVRGTEAPGAGEVIRLPTLASWCITLRNTEGGTRGHSNGETR